MAGGVEKPEPLMMDVRIVIIGAPRDIKAIWAIQQVLDNLQLSKTERINLLAYMHRREEDEEAPF
jgi:hypothetical protein